MDWIKNLSDAEGRKKAVALLTHGAPRAQTESPKPGFMLAAVLSSVFHWP